MKILYKEIPWIDPFDAYVSLRGDGPSFLLESLGGNLKTSRYSFIGTNPKIIITSKGNNIKISNVSHSEPTHGDPLGKMGTLPIFSLEKIWEVSLTPFIRHLLKRKEIINQIGLPPFMGGAAGYFGYDLVHHFERMPHRVTDDLQLPDMVLMIVDVIVAFDHRERRGWIIAVPDGDLEGENEGEGENGNTYKEEIAQIEDRLKKGEPYNFHRSSGLKVKIISNLTRKEYLDMVERCKGYISSGDIYQANLSQRLSAYIKGVDPLNIYRVLRDINPSPFSAFIDTGEMQIVSSSPERLVRLQDGLVETRPIAGTRPRGNDEKENGRLRQELLASEKERAEHIMLVDLERNDLGRVCRYKSIRVDEFMVLESYSHVTHIVSNVAGEIKSGKDAFDIIRAVFPGGTITGVPKIRCMEIIDELEPTARGPYTGSIGYISYTGNMDLNIIIRSFIIKDGWAHVQVGAGIVADSDPEREYYETLYKAEALLKTLDML